MPIANSSYEIINLKLQSLKTSCAPLREKRDEYVFSALCIKSNIYKNPALTLLDSDFEEMIVDGQYDGGVDILLTDPSSEEGDLVIAQSKYYSTISAEEVTNALAKMVTFYQEMELGHYEVVNPTVQRKYLSLRAEMGDEAKIQFVLYTSAPKARIQQARIIERVSRQLSDAARFEFKIYFGKDIEDEIKESESRRPTVEFGKVRIDERDNYLMYGDDAAIVNVSAFSIKTLYAIHMNNLLSQTLPYHVRGRDIDKGIQDTIKDFPELFWMMNNGITIICDSFDIDGREVKLRNFSIVNGGQTTYLLHRSKYISEEQDLYLPCKIIRTIGSTQDEKDEFSLSIAKATNSQKAIKPIDLKANAPEQVRFARAMREVGLFYQTKRGETVERQFREPYLNSDLAEIGKLCLAGIFQLPGTSRSKPKSMYSPEYYDKIFGGDQLRQLQIAKICKELLYIDSYFRSKFLKKFDRDAAESPDANIRIALAHNARTICIAFVAFACRFSQNNFSAQDLQVVFNASRSENAAESGVYTVFENLDGIQTLLPSQLFVQKDRYEAVLDRFFNTIIDAGITSFMMASNYDATITPTNYLKKDKSYYGILREHWARLRFDITNIWNSAQEML